MVTELWMDFRSWMIHTSQLPILLLFCHLKRILNTIKLLALFLVMRKEHRSAKMPEIDIFISYINPLSFNLWSSFQEVICIFLTFEKYLDKMFILQQGTYFGSFKIHALVSEFLLIYLFLRYLLPRICRRLVFWI